MVWRDNRAALLRWRMQRPRNSSGTSTLATLDPLFRLGLMLFSFAMVGLGVETVIDTRFQQVCYHPIYRHRSLTP